MREFQITYFDRYQRAIATMLAIGPSRGYAARQAAMARPHNAASYEIEEV